RPIDQRRNDLANRQSQRMRQARNDKSCQIGNAPDQAIPDRPVVERIIQIDQEWCVGLEFFRDRGNRGLSIRHVVKNPERESEIERLRRQRYSADTVQVIADIVDAAEVLFCNAQRFGAGIKQVQMLDLRRDQHRPTTGAAADIESNAATFRQHVPWKDAEIIVENGLAFLVRKMLWTLSTR